MGACGGGIAAEMSGNDDTTVKRQEVVEVTGSDFTELPLRTTQRGEEGFLPQPTLRSQCFLPPGCDSSHLPEEETWWDLIYSALDA